MNKKADPESLEATIKDPSLRRKIQGEESWFGELAKDSSPKPKIQGEQSRLDGMVDTALRGQEPFDVDNAVHSLRRNIADLSDDQRQQLSHLEQLQYDQEDDARRARQSRAYD